MGINYRFIILAGILTVLSLMILLSCRKEFVVGDPPRLPPSETFLMNFAGFSNPSDTLSSALNSDSLESSSTFNNWRHAYNTVSAWDSIADFPISIVTTCYSEAVKNNPVHLGGHAFGWPCSFIYLNSGYTASLIANWVTSEEFKIEMYISKPGMYGFSSFKWLEGTVRFDWSRASWSLYESPNNSTRLLRIDWNKNWETNSGDIKYTFMRRTPIPSGSYIQFRQNSENVFDASYVVSLFGNKILIEWNSKDKQGRINDPVKYKDNGAWHCWSPTLRDRNCDNLTGEQ